MPPVPTITTVPLDWLSFISLIVGIASLALGAVAIWISFHFKRESDTVNQKTNDLLTEIRTDAKTVSQVALPELKAYGDSMRRLIVERYPSSDPDPTNLKELRDDIARIEKQLQHQKPEEIAKSFQKSLDELQKRVEQKISSIPPKSEEPKKTDERLNIKLPGGKGFLVSALDIQLRTLMDVARDILKDEKITPEHFGADKYFFFVNRTTGTLIDNQVSEFALLRALKIQLGQEIELCLTKLD